MLEHLKLGSHILVTGSQRSGTTIAGKIIAAETHLPYIDEAQFRVDDLASFIRLAKKPGVYQAPGLCHVAHTLPYIDTVIFMTRSFDEIQRSVQRIEWGKYNNIERSKYTTRPNPVTSWHMKWIVWDSIQRELCNGQDLEYHSLKDHPLWIAERKNFTPKQTV